MGYFGGYADPHNVIIAVFCYTGIIGLLVFLIFFFRIIANAIKRNKYGGELLPIILLIPILGMVLTGQIFVQKIIWILFAYIAGSSTKKVKTANRVQQFNAAL